MSKAEKRSKGKKSRSRKALQSKSVGAAPVWLKTVAISKPGYGRRIKGTFGAASEVKRIDPSDWSGEA